MLFPNEIQSVILYDRRVTQFDALVAAFMKMEEERNGTRYNMLEAKQGTFYQMFGTNDLMMSFEYMDKQANPAVFKPALSSPMTRLGFPEVEQHLASHQSHILINIQHGAMGGREVADMLAKMGMDLPGTNYADFAKRLGCATTITQMALALDGASLVHWTQSDQLLSPTAFKAFAEAGIPGPLQVHPYLFGEQDSAGEQLVGIRTFGVRHFLGGEVIIEPNVLPWVENYQIIFTFMRVALAPNGYIIPDDDTFGNEDQSISYRVRHIPTSEGDVPLYRLEPLLNRDFGFQSPDYVPTERRIDDQRPPSDLMPDHPPERAELMGEWRAKRQMAEGIGGQFEVRAKGTAPIAPPPPQNRLGRVFGRKGAA
jgi:hypothetical protein